MTEILLPAMVFGPLAVGLLLKSNAAMGFLALSAGVAVVTYGGSDLESAIKQLGLKPYGSNTIELLILVLPLVITLLLTHKAVTKRSKYQLQAIAALGAGGLLAFSAVPLLGGATQVDIVTSQPWINLQKLQASIVGVGALCSLILIWFTAKHSHSSKSKKH